MNINKVPLMVLILACSCGISGDTPTSSQLNTFEQTSKRKPTRGVWRSVLAHYIYYNAVNPLLKLTSFLCKDEKKEQ